MRTDNAQMRTNEKSERRAKIGLDAEYENSGGGTADERRWTQMRTRGTLRAGQDD
jgi:hypothetical protein